MRRSTIPYALLLLTIIVGGSLVPRVSSLSSLTGDWESAKLALRHPDCCVVSVSGLEHHLQVLQKELVDKGLSDLDLRSRIRASHNSASSDCSRVLHSVVPIDNNLDHDSSGACMAALEELARGIASLADGPLNFEVEDVHMRVVCASDYRAVDPMFHTDKCPIRGYVTLCGVGTEFMTRTCTPMEYMSLRSLGKQPSSEPSDSVREANELEFIVMKGDYYPQQGSSWLSKVWQRAFACVHRSPPGNGGRRVIVSLDLADGDDDREWYDAGQKREWRSGMTQRKSRLVA
jgi:Protein of unknown function (DUF1826)